MVIYYMVGMNIKGKAASVTVEAEDALKAALKAKQENPAAMITYVRKHNRRGDRRHPHPEVEERKRGAAHRPASGAL